MISPEQAQTLVLNLLQEAGTDEKFVICYCSVAPLSGHWILSANSEDGVYNDMPERLYVGVSAYLVNASTGAISTVPSYMNWERYLQDIEDLAQAGSNYYVLEPAFDATDRAALMNLRQRLLCSYSEALALVAPENRRWLTSKRRSLEVAQESLRKCGIETVIELRPYIGNATVVFDSNQSPWEQLVPLILQSLRGLNLYQPLSNDGAAE